MKLFKVDLHGYKRFQQESSMKVDGKLVAIVGPNESGKSSFLQALEHLNEPNAFVTSGGSQETTRNSTIPDNQDVVKATYLLEDADTAALDGIPGGKNARWFTVAKKVAGDTFYCSIIPTPRLSLNQRQAAVKNLKDAANHKIFQDLKLSQNERQLLEQINNLAFALDTDTQNIAGEPLSLIQNLTATLDVHMQEYGTEFLQRLSEQLKALDEYESSDPERQAREILVGRRPVARLFTDEERLLLSEYDLTAVWSNPPAALRNLANLAELDLRSLHRLAQENDQPQVRGLEAQANERLRAIFDTVWSQSSVSIEFRINGTILHVQVREPNLRFSSIAERSDGLRQFVSLVAFSAQQPSERGLILLIDEAETHLHYNAQADLVQMLARQEIVSKVIYTTHSIGCLPEDLGTGVRLVVEDPSSPFSSRIENSFWVSDRSGFSPLLFGMGASTLAFIPIRNAVITEGASDMILWPTLFREATGRTHLDFQVSPGLSEANTPEMIRLDGEAPRSAYLLDADKGGDDLIKQLEAAGISDNSIFQVPRSGHENFVIEDLVDADVYVRAVNEELRLSHGSGYQFLADTLPESNRPEVLRTWCSEQGIREPRKRAVAYRVLEIGAGGPVLEKRYYATVQQLFTRISARLDRA